MIVVERLFIDTNIMLDFLGEREGFYEPIAKLATLAERGQYVFVTSSLSFATVYYILSKVETDEKVRGKLRKYKILSEVCNCGEDIIEKGLNSFFSDFEDSLQYFSALDASCDIIITRNIKDFKKSLIPVMTAAEFLKSIPKKLK